jgi:short-subunit dehydrogenase
MDFQGKTVLITGASSGIGRAFAEALAARGAGLILVARSKARLETLARRLRKDHSATVDVIRADLSREAAPRAIHSAVRRLRRSVDVLINNAGFGTYGPFHELPEEEEHREVMVNVAAPVRLAHLVLPDMVRRGAGVVINVASAAAFQPAPYMAVYGATKAFLLSFSEALWAEYRGRGIRILAVCPGPTDTGFFTVARNEQAAIGRKRSAEQVVATALRGLDRGRSYVVDGGLIYLGTLSVRLAPRGVVAASAARIMSPRRPAPRTSAATSRRPP